MSSPYLRGDDGEWVVDLAILPTHCMAAIRQHKIQYEHAETKTETRGDVQKQESEHYYISFNFSLLLLKHVDMFVYSSNDCI